MRAWCTRRPTRTNSTNPTWIALDTLKTDATFVPLGADRA